jgi:hypothetical protein
VKIQKEVSICMKDVRTWMNWPGKWLGIYDVGRYVNNFEYKMQKNKHLEVENMASTAARLREYIGAANQLKNETNKLIYRIIDRSKWILISLVIVIFTVPCLVGYWAYKTFDQEQEEIKDGNKEKEKTE